MEELLDALLLKFNEHKGFYGYHIFDKQKQFIGALGHDKSSVERALVRLTAEKHIGLSDIGYYKIEASGENVANNIQTLGYVALRNKGIAAEQLQHAEKIESKTERQFDRKWAVIRFRWSLGVSIFALLVSFVSMTVNLSRCQVPQSTKPTIQKTERQILATPTPLTTLPLYTIPTEQPKKDTLPSSVKTSGKKKQKK